MTSDRRPERTPRNAAMDLLARREHSQLELQRKLSRHFEPGTVESALRDLAGEGLQSDRRFAEAFARERVLRGYGPLRIVSELGQRGVDEGHASAALAAVREEEGIDWRQQARRALTKKFGGSELPADFRERARRLRFLNYRGFNTSELDTHG